MIHFFVIHVAHHHERLETFRRRMELMPKEWFSFEIIDAVVHEKGMEGCRQSHQKVIEIAKERNLDCCWVLEDDVLFTTVNTVLHSRNIIELENNTRWKQHIESNHFKKLHDVLIWGQNLVMADDIDYFLGGAHGILHNDEIHPQDTIPLTPQPQRKFRGTVKEIPVMTVSEIQRSFDHNNYYSPRRPVSYRSPHQLVSFPSSGLHCVCYGSRRAYDAVLRAPPKMHIDVYLSYLTYAHGLKMLYKWAHRVVEDVTILKAGIVFPFVAIAYTARSSIRDETCEYDEEMDYFIGAEQRVQYFLDQKKA